MIAEPWRLSITEIGAAFRAGRLDPVTLVGTLCDRIAQLDPVLNSFINFDPEPALSQARHYAAELATSVDRGPLHGVPIGIKDMIDVAGVPTTCHSRTMLDRVATADAALVERLRDAGAIIMGKLAMHELSLGGPSFDLPFPPARNPWNTAHQPGGSSSGSAVAVAAGLVPGAIGSDTAGSIRGPAGNCGVVGLKPSFGHVSRFGTVPLAPSLDHLGPIARTAQDAALLLDAIAGYDTRDPDSIEPSHRPASMPNDDLAGTRIGYIRRFHEVDLPCDPEIAAMLDCTAAALGARGVEVSTVDLPPLQLFAAVNRTIMLAEGYAAHGRWLRKRPADLGIRTRAAFLPGAFIPAEQLARAYCLKRELTRAVDCALEQVDMLLFANALCLPARFDDDAAIEASFPPQARTVANLTGHPCVSVPAGWSDVGLPMSLQLLGRQQSDRKLLLLAAVLSTGGPNAICAPL